MVPPVTNRGPAGLPPQARAGAAAEAAEGAEATAAAGPAGAAAQQYTVVKGDSLWKIAEGLKGSAPAFKDLPVAKIVDLIRADNPHLLSGPKRKPDGGMIFPGDVVKIPQPAAPSAPPATGGATPPPGGWANTGTPSRNPAAAAAAAAAGKGAPTPQTPAAVLEQKYPAAVQALSAPVVSAAQVDFIRDFLGEIKKGDPEVARTPKFQDLLNRLDDADKKIDAGQKSVDSTVQQMVAKLKTGAVKPEEATAMFQSLNKLAPMIRDQEATFGEVVPLLEKAGGTPPQQAPEGTPQAGPAGNPANAARASGNVPAATATGAQPDQAAIEAQAMKLLETMLTSEKVPSDLRAMVKESRLLSKAGKPDEAQALFNKAMDDKRMKAFIQEYAAQR